MQRLKAVENGISGLRKACRMPNRRRATGLAVCKKAELHTERRFRVSRCVKTWNCTRGGGFGPCGVQKRGIAHRTTFSGLAVCKNVELHTGRRFWALRCAKRPNCTPRFRHSLRLSSSMTHYDIVNVPPSHPARPTTTSRTTHPSSSTLHHDILDVPPSHPARPTTSS